MITVNYPDAVGLDIQQYYIVWDEASTGCRLLLGPFYADPAGNDVASSSFVLDWGPPGLHPEYLDSFDNQNSCMHRNAKGVISVSKLNVFSRDAFLSFTDKGYPGYTGQACAMSDFTTWGRYSDAFRGYQRRSSLRETPGGLNVNYPAFYGSVSYSLEQSSGYMGAGSYAGNRNIVTGQSSYGYIKEGGYQKYARQYTLVGNMTVDGDTRYRTMHLVETHEDWSQGVLRSSTTSSWDAKFPCIFTSPQMNFSSTLLSDIRYDVLWRVNAAVNRLTEPENIFGTLCKEAVQSIEYSSSDNLENAVSFKDPRSIVPPIRSIKNLVAKKSPKALMDIYLWYKYSLKPNCSDAVELVHAAATKKKQYTGKFFRSAVHSRSYTSSGLVQTCISRASVRFSVDPEYHAKMVMQSWGVDLSFESGWDLVPFSFVVDWFCNVGDTLSNFDYELDNFTNTYHYRYINCSNKVTAVVPDLGAYMGYVNVSLYTRIPLRTVPFTYERQPSSVSSHILEAAALIVTR